MENSQKKTVSFEVPNKEAIAAKRPLIPASFGFAIFMFLFTFCDIQCTNQKIGSITGLQLVTGTTIKTPGGGLGDLGDLGNTAPDVPANIWAIIALASAIGGLAIFLKKHPKEAIVGTAAGAAGFVSLIILRLTAGFDSSDALGDVPITVKFKFAFWMALLALGAAGAISYLRLGMEQKEESFPYADAENDDENTTLV